MEYTGLRWHDKSKITKIPNGKVSAIMDSNNRPLFAISEEAGLVIAALPGHYERDTNWYQKGDSVAADRRTLVSPEYLTVNINNHGYALLASQEYDLSDAAVWDDISGTDYTVASNRKGKDFYIYACEPDMLDEVMPKIVISPNATYPTGYNSSNSRKVGGFHSLCADVGTISGHPLSGFVAGDILPTSIWDLNFRPKNHMPEGMAYDEKDGLWKDIYLISGNGVNTASVYGGTISDSRNWMDFVDDLGNVGKKLLDDIEFQLGANGSNEGTNITGSADPVTTGGHVDTAGRRMISWIGLEDCCGVEYQWLRDQSYRADSFAHTHTQNILYKATATGDALYKDGADSAPNAALASAANETITSNSTEPAPAFTWKDEAGGKGQLNTQGLYGDIKLLAGASWNKGTNCGSRARNAYHYRWDATSYIGGRGRCASE